MKYKQKPAKHKSSDTVLVIDVASTCWKDRKSMTAENPKMRHSIIEVAATPISIKDLTIGDTEDFIIKPKQDNSVSRFCTEITGITQEMCDNGTTLKKCFASLKEKFVQKEAPIVATFGMYDIKMIKYQIERFKLKYPFNSGFMDLRRLVSITLGLPRDVSLSEAMKAAGVPFTAGRAKRALHNSQDAARLIVDVWSRARECASKKKIVLYQKILSIN